MSNVISMTEALERKMEKHLDMAEVWKDSGDYLASEDHLKIAESILYRIHEIKVHNKPSS